MTADPHSWARELVTLHDHAWQRLLRGVHDRHAPARHPTLATVTPDGLPAARTVVLRAADQSAGRLELHTNLHSAKIADLRATPVAALHVWDNGSRLQIRLEADVAIATGPEVAASSGPGCQSTRAMPTAAVSDPATRHQAHWTMTSELIQRCLPCCP